MSAGETDRRESAARCVIRRMSRHANGGTVDPDHTEGNTMLDYDVMDRMVRDKRSARLGEAAADARADLVRATAPRSATRPALVAPGHALVAACRSLVPRLQVGLRRLAHQG